MHQQKAAAGAILGQTALAMAVSHLTETTADRVIITIAAATAIRALLAPTIIKVGIRLTETEVQGAAGADMGVLTTGILDQVLVDLALQEISHVGSNKAAGWYPGQGMEQ